MKLKYLGESEDEARLYIVVQCDREIVKKVERFFAQKHVLEDLGSDFLIDVRGGTLLSLSGAMTLHVSAIPDSRSTFCGMSIHIRNGDVHQRATFGGLIAVTMPDNRTVLYGVTAAHPTATLILGAAEDDERDSSDSDSLFEETTRSAMDMDVETEENGRDPAPSESSSLGTITERGLIGKRDWALIELACESLLPNRLSQTQLLPTRSALSASQSPEQKDLDLFAPHRQSPSLQSNHAAVVTSRGLQCGQISSNGSIITTSLGAEFIEVFDFIPENDAKLLPGDSGSWVVNSLTGEVYGHVVSIDEFGEANIIPIQGSLESVREHLDAHSVTLPS
ncbi:hypothetical protein B0T25DRAFT_440863, partial [Lasiosphaeria hispida]